MSETSQKSRRALWLVLIGISLFVIGAFALFPTDAPKNTGNEGANTAIAALAKGEMRNFVQANAGTDHSGFAFKDGKGNDMTLAHYQGQVILLNFWATWCAPCRVEMPSLSHLQRDLGDKDFAVVTISLDRKGVDVVHPFFQQVQIDNLPDHIDSDSTALRKMGLRGLPVTILIDRDGTEIGRVTGPAEWDHDDAKALIRQAITKAGV